MTPPPDILTLRGIAPRMFRLLTLRERLVRCVVGVALAAFLFQAYAVTLDHAKITEVVNQVSVLDPHSMKGAPAKASDLFKAPEIMKTGAASRSELVAEDQTITRVGANTLFSFEPQSRVINLKQGSLLFQSPAGKGGGTIKTASATASVLGTTIIVVATKDGGFKLIVLEGTAEVRMANGKHKTLHGGQMIYVPPGAHDPGLVLDFRLTDIVGTSRLVTGFKRPLPSWDKIQKQIVAQEKQIGPSGSPPPGMVLGVVPDPNKRINQIQALHPFVPAPAAPAVTPPGQPAAAGTTRRNPGGGTTGGSPPPKGP